MAKEPKSKLPNLLPKVEDLLKKELSQLSVQELGIIGNAIVGSVIQKDNPLTEKLRNIIPAFSLECFLAAEKLLIDAANKKSLDALKDASSLMKYLSAKKRAQLRSLVSIAMKANESAPP